MILGMGVDLVSVTRIEQAIARWGGRFLKKVYVPSEIKYCQSQPEPNKHFASRFAAKEAFAKAFGTGFSKGLYFKSMIVTREGACPPSIKLQGPIQKLAEKKGIRQIFLSLSDEENMAIAMVILSGR